MKKVSLPKFVIILGAILLIGISFFFGYKCCESLVKPEKETCEPIIRYVEKCDKPVVADEKFEVGENKYIITTSTKYATMQNDGGSHTNIYYEIDLNTNKVNKREDKYVGFKGYEYQRKLLSKKTLTSDEATEVKSIIDDAIANKVTDETYSEYTFYELTTKDDERIVIKDNDTITRLNTLLG